MFLLSMLVFFLSMEQCFLNILSWKQSRSKKDLKQTPDRLFRPERFKLHLLFTFTDSFFYVFDESKN